MPADVLSTTEAAALIGVSASTLRRWAAQDLFAGFADRGGWSPAAVAHGGIVHRLRERGHSLGDIRAATQDGRLAFGYVDELIPRARGEHTLAQAAELTGLEPRLIERILSTIGFSAISSERVGDDDLELLGHIVRVLDSGFPLGALLQLVRVYGQALAQIADAEVRLIHLYIHEPMLRDGVPGLEISEQVGELTARILPLASPAMDHVHRRFLQHFVEQDVVGHMESDLDGAAELGRLRVAIAFADLAGYTQLTERRGDAEAAGTVERFVALVSGTLPDDARIVKTIGDAVMIVSSDPASLTDWAVGFQVLAGPPELPAPRIGIHAGHVLYRDGDYFGREVNLASRVAARAAAGQVLVTSEIVAAAGSHLAFTGVGQERLKGFSRSTALYTAVAVDGDPS